MKITVTVKIDERRKRRARLLWEIGPISEQPQGATIRRKRKMLKLTNTQQAALSISAVDRRNKPALVDSVVWTSSDDTVATVTADTADPMKATVKAIDAGTAQINVSADADLGDGERPITGALDVTVVAGEAVALVIGTGTPTEQPEA
jgi:uncharacterized protein YjdB